jgi:hypothetical protein
MTKSEAVSTVKRANNRLKPVGDACFRIAQQRDIRLPQKEQKLMLARLDRELTPEDIAGPALRDAVDLFWRELFAGADAARQMELANAVYLAVRQVQSERWLRLESQYGKVSHYFDRFGQIKKRYRQPKEEEIELPPLKGCAITLIVLLGLIVSLVWWLVS